MSALPVVQQEAKGKKRKTTGGRSKGLCRYTKKPGGCANPVVCKFYHPVCDRVSCQGYSDGCGLLHPMTLCRWGSKCRLDPHKMSQEQLRAPKQRTCSFQHDRTKSFCVALFCGDDCDELCGQDHRCPDEIFFRRPCAIDPESEAVCLFAHGFLPGQKPPRAVSPDPTEVVASMFSALEIEDEDIDDGQSTFAV